MPAGNHAYRWYRFRGYGHIHNNTSNDTYKLTKKLKNAYNVGADILGFTPRTLAEVRKMNEELNIPKSFKDAGVDEKEFLAKVDLLADRAFEDQCTTANPRVPLVSEIKQILLDSYYGK